VNDDGSNPNKILPYGELEYTGGSYVLAAAAGSGGYFKGFDFHIALGSLSWM
jgi:hypothetical protein